jgi:ABC-type lipoprotein release transport system permease subunit
MNQDLFGFALGSIRRRPARHLALAVALTLATVLLAGSVFLLDALRDEAERMKDANPDVCVQSLLGGRPTVIAISDRDKILDIPSVRAVRPRVWGYVFVPALSGNVTVVGVSARMDETLGDFAATLGRGRPLDVTSGATNEMVAGAKLAEFMGLRLGDELGLPSVRNDARPLKLVGTFASSVEHYAADVIVTSDIEARRILGLPEGTATDLAVSVINPSETGIIAKTIGERLPGTRVIERESMLRVLHLTYGRRAGLLLVAAIPAIFALLVLAWDRASGISDSDKREIGVLKALGFSTRNVLSLKLVEALVTSVTATAVGLMGAYAWVFLLGAPGLRAALVGWSVLYPDAPLSPSIDVATVLGIALAVIGPFVLLSIAPAWKAATTDPSDVLRG